MPEDELSTPEIEESHSESATAQPVDALTQKVLSIIAETMRKDPALVKENTPFEELGIDSMDAVNIVFALENEFNINIPDEDVKAIRGIPDMVAGVRKLVNQQMPASE